MSTERKPFRNVHEYFAHVEEEEATRRPFEPEILPPILVYQLPIEGEPIDLRNQDNATAEDIRSQRERDLPSLLAIRARREARKFKPTPLREANL